MLKMKFLISNYTTDPQQWNKFCAWGGEDNPQKSEYRSMEQNRGVIYNFI